MPEIEWKELPVNSDGLMEFEVPYSKWLRGKRQGRLRDPETGRQCCLGCLGSAMGIPDNYQNDKQLPCEVAWNIADKNFAPSNAYRKLAEASHSDILSVTKANDNETISDEERILVIKEGLAVLGFKPIFIDDENPVTV